MKVQRTISMEYSPCEAVIQLVKKFPTFYGTWRPITMLTRVCPWITY